MYEYKAKCINVVDGDTLDLEIDLGLQIFTKQRVRLKDINTPETNRKAEREEGLKSKAFVETFVYGKCQVSYYDKSMKLFAKSLTVKTYKDKKGKFGRWIVDIFNEQGASLCKSLVKNGLAEVKIYD